MGKRPAWGNSSVCVRDGLGRAVRLWPPGAEGRGRPTRAGVFQFTGHGLFRILTGALGSGQLLAGLCPSGAAMRWGNLLRCSVLPCWAPLGVRHWAQVFAHESSHVLPATETTDTVCQPCPDGFFSSGSSLSEKCHPWTRYKGHLSLTNSRVGPVSVSVSLATVQSRHSPPPWPHLLVNVTLWWPQGHFVQFF